MSRGERIVVGLGLTLALAALVARSVLSSAVVATIAPRLAVALAPCEVSRRVDRPVEVAGEDPWGRGWCRWDGSHARSGVVWSAGPDGVDQHGGGDDLLRADVPVGCPIWPLLASPRATCAISGLLLVWVVVVGRLASGPRGRELARAALALLPPGAAIVGMTLVVVGSDELSGAMTQLLVPFPIAAGGTAVLAMMLLATSWWQMRRGAAAAEETGTQGRRWIAIVLGLCAITPVGLACVGRATARASHRDTGVAAARLRLIGRAQVEFFKREQRYATVDELVATGLIPPRFVEAWRGHRIDVQLGRSPPTWAAVAAPLPGEVVEVYLAITHGTLYWKRGPHQLGPNANMDPGAFPESW